MRYAGIKRILAESREAIAESNRSVSLFDAEIGGANLAAADLTDADLRRTNVADAEFKGAKYNDRTQLPEGLDPVEAGMKKVD